MHKRNSVLAFALCAQAALVSAHSLPEAPEPTPLDPLLLAFGFNDLTPIRTQKLAEGMYVLFGLGGNILVSSGKDGVVIVDDQFPRVWDKLSAAMQAMGDEGVDFAINTHWHFDHAEGNKTLGQQGTWLVSQANSREMMRDDHLINLVSASYVQQAYPEHALPDITYDESMQFHLNGEQVDLMHFGPAHTTGDTAVMFRGRNAVHLGDVYNNAGYPFIDAGNGGSLEGVIHFCESVLEEIDEDTIVVPGHGPVSTYAELAAYTEMLSTIRDDMVAMIKDGKSLEAIQAAGITARWDKQYGDPTSLLNRSYVSLTTRYLD